jgi:hypothetical protein
VISTDTPYGRKISRVSPIRKFLTALYPPEVSFMAPFSVRERVRRGKLFVVITLLLIIVTMIILPATFFITNKLAVFVLLALLLLCVFALFLNRMEQTNFAGILIVCAVEAVITAIILTTRPFDTFNLPLFDLLSISVLLSVSLLPASYVFGAMGINLLVIWGSLSLQIHTTALQTILQTQFYNALSRPAILQIVLGVICFLWVRNAKNALQRADTAEELARLQSAIAAHERNIANDKERLERNIEAIIETHTEALNGNTIASIPLPTGTPLLIPLVSALNNLWVRLYHSRKAERDLEQIRKELIWCLEVLQKGEPIPDRILQQIPAHAASASLIRAIIIRERRLSTARRQ